MSGVRLRPCFGPAADLRFAFIRPPPLLHPQPPPTSASSVQPQYATRHRQVTHAVTRRIFARSTSNLPDTRTPSRLWSPALYLPSSDNAPTLARLSHFVVSHPPPIAAPLLAFAMQHLDSISIQTATSLARPPPPSPSAPHKHTSSLNAPSSSGSRLGTSTGAQRGRMRAAFKGPYFT